MFIYTVVVETTTPDGGLSTHPQNSYLDPDLARFHAQTVRCSINAVDMLTGRSRPVMEGSSRYVDAEVVKQVKIVRTETQEVAL